MNTLDAYKLLHGDADQPTKPVNYAVKLEAVEDDLDYLYKIGYKKGYHLGFNCLSELYTILPGKMTFIVGQPTGGKSYFWFEVLLNLAQYHCLKHIVFSSEMGKPHEIYADLIGMYNGHNFFKLPDQVIEDSKKFIGEHFTIIEPNSNELTIPMLFEHAKGYDTLTADPFNELTHNFSDDYNRQDLYIERQLGFMRRMSEQMNVHTCVITHPRDQQVKQVKDIRYHPKPTAREFAGGQAWYRKGLGMLSVWRPPYGLSGEDDQLYEKNEVHIDVLKAKPRGVGQEGSAKLFLDTEKWRYYERDSMGVKHYARDISKNI